jgi:ADP-heptose:LPS heptosyltransferase
MQPTPNILVIRRRYLGDIVLLGSLFRSLKAHWPAARVAALVERPYGEILGLNPDVDSVLELPGRGMGWPGFLGRLRRRGFTHVLDIDNTEKTALVARASGAPVRVALHHGEHRLRLRGMYTQVVHDPGDEHEARPITEYYLKALGPIGVPVAAREVRLVPREDDIARWRRFVGAQGRVLLVHPGSRSASRIWPADRFAEVCDRVQDDLGAQVVLVGGPGERRILSEIRGLARSHLLAVDEAPSLARFAALARVSSALLCHDSGPMHVAAAVGTPVVALYGSQNPELFRPHGKGHTQIVPPQPCSPCLAPGACVPGDSYRTFCVRQITVIQVLDAVRRALMGSDGQPGP